MKNQHLLIALMFMLLCSFCKDDDMLITEIPMNTGENVVTTIAGYVFDEEMDPVANAEVKIGSNITSTDLNGVFIFNDIVTQSDATYIKVTQEGYLYNSKRVYPSNNSRFNLRFQLLKDRLEGSIRAEDGGEINLDNGAKISFPANAIAMADGSLFSGNVYVHAKYLDPTDDDLFEKMPGELVGIETDGSTRALASYGMMAVELTDNYGELLQIAEGAKASLSFPIPEELLANAPSSIPLWHFDEVIGSWVEDGNATLIGNNYEGEVSHFSFWNCDAPYDLVYVSGKLIDQEGDPVSNMTLKVVVLSNGTSAGGVVDEQGNFVGFMPKDEVLEFNVIPISNLCISTPLFTEEFGPFAQDTELVPIEINHDDAEIIKISGTLADCNGAAIEQGYLKLVFNGIPEIILVESGNFDLAYPSCGFQELVVTAYDLDNSKVSDPLSFSFSNTIEIGPIIVCEEDLMEFIEVQRQGAAPIFYLNPSVYRTQNSTILTDLNGYENPVKIVFNGTSTGEFPLLSFSTFPENNDIVVTITNYGGPGEFITGSYEGTVMISGNEFARTGRFRVLNDAVEPAQTNCSIPETSFTGAYNLEIVAGGENCFGELFSPDSTVILTYISEFERRATLAYIPVFGGFDIEVDFILSCENVYIPFINSGVGCSSSIYLEGGFPLETFDPSDDSVLQFNLTDFINQDCGCPPNPGNVFKLTKQ